MSTRKIVSFSGTLQGEGGQADCTVMATQVTLPGTGVSAYARYSIHSVSKNLPDGKYLLTANGETTPIMYRGGHWLAAQ